jgi:putative salt-induced outer membrane protein YdiY
MRNRADGIDRARRITGALRTGVNITNNVDFFALGTYMQNRFRGIEHQYMVTPGLGIYPINTDQISVRFEGAAGWMKEEYTLAPFMADRNFTVGTAGLGMRFKLTDVADLTNDFLYIIPITDSDDWRINNTAGIVTAMSSVMSLKLAHITEYRKLPVPGFKATDNTTTAGVVFKF